MKTLLTEQCYQCKKEFPREKKRMGIWEHAFCSKECKKQFFSNSSESNCSECGTAVLRKNSQMNRSKSGHLFCCKSCAATFNNRLKRKSRRSQCEQKLLEMLRREFPSVAFEPNDKSMLDGYEVDIAIPFLKMAIEWNGIVHFKPIYGQHKLNRIQEIDAQKEKKAKEKNIGLIVVPDLVSTDDKVNEAFGEIASIISLALQDV